MSLKTRAILVSLSVGKPQLTKTDKKATDAAEKAVNAKNAGRYRKDLYPRHLVQPITTIESSARGYLERMTYPWSKGEHLLPTARFMEFADQMATYEREFDQAVTAFLQNFVNALDEAKRAQGELFNTDDYPDLTELRRRFRFSVGYSQITDASDIRVALQDSELDMVRKAVERQTREQMNDLMREPVVRLREVVARIHEKMAEGDRTVEARGGNILVKPPIFRDSLIGNLEDEVKLLEDFADILGGEYKSLAAEAKQLIVEPEKLRSSGAQRDVALTNSSKLLADIDNLLAN